MFSFSRGRLNWESGLLIAKWSATIAIFSFLLLLALEKLSHRKLSDSTVPTVIFIIKYISCGVLAVFGTKYIFLFFLQSEMLSRELPFAIYQVIIFSILFGGFRLSLRQTQEKFLLERNYKDAEYAALKSKLNPHFLFNTLNLISSEIEYDPKNANTLLEELSELIHSILTVSKRKFIPLKQELELLEHYLNLQQQRFEDRFEYTINADEESLSVPVPPLILQPFAENFFVHGFADIEGLGELNIQSKREQNGVILSLADNGSGFNSEDITPGHGTTIVRDALELLYGNRHKFEIKSAPGIGTTVTIQIPVK